MQPHSPSVFKLNHDSVTVIIIIMTVIMDMIKVKHFLQFSNYIMISKFTTHMTGCDALTV